jgi:hypothetical protein
MKRIPGRVLILFTVLLIGVSYSPVARSATGASGKQRKTPADGAANHFVSERGPHHRVWQKVTSITDEQGNTITETNQAYVELATGLHYQNARGQWVESKEEFE